MSVVALPCSMRSFTPEASERLAAIRLRAVDACPYLATALYRLRPVCAPGLDTFAVDRYWRMYVDPVALFRWSILEGAGVLLHEAGHVIRAHAERADNHGVNDFRRWNYAADAEINDDLLAAGITLPEGVITPTAMGWPENDRAEVYYGLCPRQAPPGTLPGESGLPGGGDGVPGDGTCGSGAGGSGRAWELDPDDPDAPGMGEGEAGLTRRQVAKDVQSHMKGRGSVPGGWASWAAEELAPPTVDWRKQFAGAIRAAVATAAGMTDYSYRRPGRRQVPSVLTPSMHRRKPKVVVVADTSGSMSTADLDAAASEIEGMIRRAGVAEDRLTVLATDAAVHGVQSVRRGRDVEFTGRGGTDMCVGIAAAAELRPDIIVVLTDGETPWPQEKPRGKLIVGMIRPSASPDPGYAEAPSWARVIHIPSDKLAPGT